MDGWKNYKLTIQFVINCVKKVYMEYISYKCTKLFEKHLVLLIPTYWNSAIHIQFQLYMIFLKIIWIDLSNPIEHVLMYLKVSYGNNHKTSIDKKSKKQQNKSY